MLAAQSGWFPVVERLLQEDRIDLDKVHSSSEKTVVVVLLLIMIMVIIIIIVIIARGPD